MNEFSQYIKIIGRGKRAGKYLTVEQAYQAFLLLLSDKVAPEQAGAFLMLLRMREESAEELAGFVKACRMFNDEAVVDLEADLDLGCYAGKRRHLPWFLLSVLCLAQSGKRIFLHGTKEPESNRLYLSDVLKQLGLSISTNGQEANANLDELGVAYMDLNTVNPALDRLIQMRKLFGLRSPANTLARMLNPSVAKVSFHGVFHRHFDERHVQVAALLNDKAVSCIRGEGGEVEVNPERPFTQFVYTNQRQSQIEHPALLDNWQIKPRELNAEELKLVWCGQLEFEYATHAVLGTLTSYLILLENLSVDAAREKAAKIWQNRNKKAFF